MPDKRLGMLGLAKRAGQLELGADSCTAAARAGRAQLVGVASDASERTRRLAERLAENGPPAVPLPWTKAELGETLGRGAPGILAITDLQLAAGFAAGLAEADPAQYADTAEALQARAARARQRKSRRRNTASGAR